MAELLLQDLSKQFNVRGHAPVTAVDSLSLAVQDGELLVLLGPSGCGKTSTLRLIAGLERPDSGRVVLGGQGIEDRPPHERNVSLVFQKPSLLPQLNVRQNVELPARLRKTPGQQELVRAAAERSDVRHLLDRYPETLSGGEAQRVALARALAIHPGVILFDEPLSNLDPPGREQLRRIILQSLRETGATALYVTHDQSEAMSLRSRIAIMNKGRIEQIGTVQELYRAPCSLFIAQFFGDGLNVLPDGDTLLAFRPGDGVICGKGLFSGEVVEVTDLGHEHLVTVRSDVTDIRIRCDRPPDLGERVHVQVSSDRLLRFEPITGRRL